MLMVGLFNMAYNYYNNPQVFKFNLEPIQREVLAHRQRRLAAAQHEGDLVEAGDLIEEQSTQFEGSDEQGEDEIEESLDGDQLRAAFEIQQQVD